MKITNEGNKNAECYLIESEILFFPEDSVLRHIEKTEEITLFSTASRCLELLIKKHGSTLSQKELMDAAWLGQGHNVTQNTFYQNISNVRKALNALLPEKQIIVTIKRIGLLIPNEISITSVLAAGTVLPSTPVVGEQERTITEDVVSIVPHAEPLPIPQKEARDSLFNKTMIGIFILSIIALASSIYLHYIKGEEKPVFPFRNYVVYKRFDNGCTIMVNPDAGKIDPLNRYLNNASDCKGYEKVYVTLWEQRMTTSALYCSPTEDGTGYSCVSEFFARSQK